MYKVVIEEDIADMSPLRVSVDTEEEDIYGIAIAVHAALRGVGFTPETIEKVLVSIDELYEVKATKLL